MAGTFSVEEEILGLSDRRVANLNQVGYSPEFIRITEELNELICVYTSMVQEAQKQHTTLSRMEESREQLINLRKGLAALRPPINKLTDDMEKKVANGRMDALHNAVCSSLNSLTRLS